MNTALEDIPIGKFDLSLSGIRITNHSRIRQVEKSMAIHGQLQPVIARICPEGYQLIDGFKRYYSSENLGMESLQCRLLDIDLSQAKVLLLSYNRPHQSMDAWEEALVLHDLMATHDLDQVTLAEVTGYSRSWVSRRLSLIEKMDPDLSGNIMMGTLTSSHARAIIKLPRGNQGEVAKVILSCHLTSRQSSVLIEAFIRATGRPQQEYRPFYYLELSFLNAREFKNLEDLKEQLQRWLNDVNDVRIHGTTKQRPLDLHVQEHAHLQPLPSQHYDTSHVERLVVNPESCVYWKGYMYVVPPKYMFELCPVRITDDSVIIYSPLGELIVTHPLAREGQKDRYIGAKQLSGKTPDLPLADIVNRLEAMGPDMIEFIGQVKRHKAGSWRHHLRALLALKVNYRVEDILLAVRRAIDYKVFEYGNIEGFLSNNATPRYGMKLNFKSNNKDNEQDQG